MVMELRPGNRAIALLRLDNNFVQLNIVLIDILTVGVLVPVFAVTMISKLDV